MPQISVVDFILLISFFLGSFYKVWLKTYHCLQEIKKKRKKDLHLFLVKIWRLLSLILIWVLQFIVYNAGMKLSNSPYISIFFSISYHFISYHIISCFLQVAWCASLKYPIHDFQTTDKCSRFLFQLEDSQGFSPNRICFTSIYNNFLFWNKYW